MHSQKCADQMNSRYLVLDDPALNKATDLYIQLTEMLGETQADDWFDNAITDTDSWTSIIEKLTAKINELTEALNDRIDRQQLSPTDTVQHARIDRHMQTHPGIV